jgi:hypothetical protein
MRIDDSRHVHRAVIYGLAAATLALLSNHQVRCDDRGKQGDDKQGSNIQRRDLSGPRSTAAADLVSVILAGVESSTDAVHTGEFSATETSKITRGGTTSDESTSQIKCVFNRRRHCIRYDCVWSYQPGRKPERNSGGQPRRPLRPQQPASADHKDSSPIGAGAAHRAVVIRRPDLTAQWLLQNTTVVLDNPQTVYDEFYLRPFDPLPAGFLTAAQISRHSAYAKTKEYLLSHKEKKITAAADGRLLKLSIRYQDVTSNGSTIETDRESWVDPDKHLVPVRTEQRQRIWRNGQADEWNSPQVTEVQWTTMSGAFVPTLIDAAMPIHSNRTLKTTFRLQWTHVNEAVSDKLFDYLALDLPKGTFVVDRRLNANKPVIVQRIGIPRRPVR